MYFRSRTMKHIRSKQDLKHGIQTSWRWLMGAMEIHKKGDQMIRDEGMLEQLLSTIRDFVKMN